MAAHTAEAMAVLPVVQCFGVGQDARVFRIHIDREQAQVRKLRIMPRVEDGITLCDQ